MKQSSLDLAVLTSQTLFRLRLAALITGVFLIGANSFVLSPILSDVAAALDTTPVAAARAISAFGGATAISALLLSAMIDRIGTRLVLMGAAIAMGIAFIGSGMSSSWQMLSAFQALAGLSTGMLLPAIYSEAVEIAPDGQGSRIMGVVLSGWSVAMIAGVPISALLADFLSWRVAYGFLAVLALAAAFAYSGFKDRKPSERRPAVPRRQALHLRGAKKLLGICLCFMTSFYGSYALLGDQVRTALGVNATLASTVVISYGAGFGLGGILVRLVDRIGPARVLPVALCFSALLYAALPVATQGMLTAILATFLLGIGNHFGLNLVVLRLAGLNPAARGTLLGLNITATYVAVFFGPLLMGVLYGGLGFGAVGALAFVLLSAAAVLAFQTRKI
ncbi:MFS transporter [Martelella sp. HB161492]|uniref:MFS transporter n=1 Tax=Martelella sp. HB161492 TaxID=2720726 RepID=UPI001590F0C3|nr:MFS transporter [Martelella sp. HB161492]